MLFIFTSKPAALKSNCNEARRECQTEWHLNGHNKEPNQMLETRSAKSFNEPDSITLRQGNIVVLKIRLINKRSAKKGGQSAEGRQLLTPRLSCLTKGEGVKFRNQLLQSMQMC